MGRNRVIYQSEALFVSPNSTSFHFKDGSGKGQNKKASAAIYDGVATLKLNNAYNERGAIRATTGAGAGLFLPFLTPGDSSDTDNSSDGSGAIVEVKTVDQDYWGGAPLWDSTVQYDGGDVVLRKAASGANSGKYHLYIAQGFPNEPTVAQTPEAGLIAGTPTWAVGTAATLDTSFLAGKYTYGDGSTNGVIEFKYGATTAGEYPLVKFDGSIYKRINLAVVDDIVNDFNAGVTNATVGSTGAEGGDPATDTTNWALVSDNVGFATELTIANSGGGASASTGYNAAELISLTKTYNWDDGGTSLNPVAEDWEILTNTGTVAAVDGTSVVAQLSRVQTANYNFTINRTDVNQFGQLGRIDSLVLEAPTVGLDFSYLLTNGENERLLGFNINDISGLNLDYSQPGGVAGQINTALSNATAALKWHASEDSKDGNNYFVLTVPEGDDAVASQAADADKSVISVGNGFVTDYSVEAAVGGLPTASLTVEAFNIKSDAVASAVTEGLPIPAIDAEDNAQVGNDGMKICDQWFALPDAKKDNVNGEISALRPGDIELHLGTAGTSSLLSDIHEGGASHIQSFSISCPIGRSVIQRLGNQYGFGRSIDFPVTLSVSVNAILSELEEANLIERLYSNPTCNLALTMSLPRDPTCSGPVPTKQLTYIVAGCRLESENYSSSIGDNKTVDLSFNAQLGGPNDKENGLFIWGTGTKRNPPHFDGQVLGSSAFIDV
tara:strand:- start:2124 stop:4295 length:2172 start_codon:yes stop_codon:yes gene_type:complete